MKEFAKDYFRQKGLASAKISVRINDNEAYGLKCVKHTRLFLFKDATASLSIDFIPQKIVPGSLFIVPAYHVYLLNSSNAGDFVVIDLDHSLLKVYHKLLLYKIKYSDQKAIPTIDESSDPLNYVSLKLLADDGIINEENCIYQLNEWIDNRIHQHINAGIVNCNYSHIDLAEKFVSRLSDEQINLDTCKIGSVAGELYCSERNLHRICTSVYGCSAKRIVQCHFTMKALYLLSDYRLSFGEVADRLSFTSTPSFNHFIKKFTGTTPTAIRTSFRMAGVW